MTKYLKGEKKFSVETQEEALKIAHSIQRPGQNKEQTKLISQGIQKGIDQYKKQHKAKARELNKQIKKVKNTAQLVTQVEDTEVVIVKKTKLPWILLITSWVFFFAYWLTTTNS